MTGRPDGQSTVRLREMKRADMPAIIALERELFPRWLREGRKIEGFVYSGQCMDIGTPDRYSRAQGVLANVEVEIDVPQGNQR